MELLWRYILSHLPSEQDAVKFLNKFILALLVFVDGYVVSEPFVYCFPDEIDKWNHYYKVYGLDRIISRANALTLNKL